MALELVNRLPYDHPYRWDGTAVGGVKLWRPDELGASLALWLDAEDTSSITLNGSKVSQWSDKSGNARHASQATASVQPTYTTAGLNGKSVVRFSTSAQFIFTNTKFGSAAQRSVFSLNTYTATPQYQYVWHQESSETSGAALVFRAQSNFSDWQQNDTISWADGYSSGNDPRFISNGVTGDGSAAIHEVSLGSQESQLRINGASANARVQLTGAWPNIARRFSVGRDSQSLNGDVAEIIYVDGAVSTTDRQKVEGYLAWKWGLTANLPADHPYKSTPPTA